MSKFNNYLIEDAAEYVREMYKQAGSETLVYHTIDHTERVVERANEIAAHYELSVEEQLELNLAAWFHDVGQITGTPSGHEKVSVDRAREWMDEKELTEDQKNCVADTIAATKMGYEPQNAVQRILKDADTYHLGTKEFKKMDDQLKEEMKRRNLGTLVQEWDTYTLELLQNHQYYTEYCRTLLAERKDKNIRKVKKRMIKNFDVNNTQTLLLDDAESYKPGKKNNIITKGIQTMMRLTSENHMRLSDMADQKANILISVNAIIISVILSVLIRKIEADRYLTIPTMIFLVTALATIVIAILATRPKITTGRFTRDEILHRKTNLLFFGNFFKTSLDDYKWAMSTMMKDPNYLYGALVDDIYYLGKVLGKKYALIRMAYNVFMVGIIVSAVAFILAYMFHSPDEGTVIINGSGSPL